MKLSYLSRKSIKMQIVFLVSSILGLAACLPLPHQLLGNFSRAPLSPDKDPERLEKLVKPKAALPFNFKRIYVSQIGQVALNTKPSTGHWIEIVGSPLSSEESLYQAAKIVSKMLAHAPAYIFNNIANHDGAGVGIFSDSERLTIFPEFSSRADTPACRNRCDGSCSYTCTDDGVKYSDIAGTQKMRAFVIESNILCNGDNTFHQNLLVFYFADVLSHFAMSATDVSQLKAAYSNAKANMLWTLSSDAMISEADYFAMGTSAFFMVNQGSETGGMTECLGHVCSTEAEVQLHIHSRDLRLYDLLSHVYFNGNPVSPSGVTLCPE